jgi:aconitate hydratase
MKLASFTLSRRDPAYVGRTQATQKLDEARANGELPAELASVFDRLNLPTSALPHMQIGSVICANKPGDGAAREQAASCQRVLGGCANICYEFATKRYRSNCINWGMLPFTLNPDDAFPCEAGDFIYVPDVRQGVMEGKETFEATVISGVNAFPITLHLKDLTPEDRELLLTGCLMNYYAEQNKG